MVAAEDGERRRYGRDLGDRGRKERPVRVMRGDHVLVGEVDHQVADILLREAGGGDQAATSVAVVAPVAGAGV